MSSHGGFFAGGGGGAGGGVVVGIPGSEVLAIEVAGPGAPGGGEGGGA